MLVTKARKFKHKKLKNKHYEFSFSMRAHLKNEDYEAGKDAELNVVILTPGKWSYKTPVLPLPKKLAGLGSGIRLPKWKLNECDIHFTEFFVLCNVPFQTVDWTASKKFIERADVPSTTITAGLETKNKVNSASQFKLSHPCIYKQTGVENSEVFSNWDGDCKFLKYGPLLFLRIYVLLGPSS
ncbi:hypothetical protein FQA39_LY02994 [Lamprigera yunnana]|nr:hypothetical protein FQA39_LY02994 [Lamprigera yunnana]